MSARVTNAQVMAALIATNARLDALLAPKPAQGSVATPIVADKPKTFFSKAEIAAGLGFPCALGCGRRLRTVVGASSHDIAHGHNIAK